MRFSDVNIKSPCSEKLEPKLAGCSGQFCKACNKTVYDFRNVSEPEFSLQLSKQGSDRCGIFYEDQIYPELYQNSSTPRIIGLALSILRLLGLSTTEGRAQEGQKPEVENFVVDKTSHGLIPRYIFKIENPKKVQSRDAAMIASVEKDDQAEEKRARVKRRKHRRKFLGVFPIRRRRVVGKF